MGQGVEESVTPMEGVSEALCEGVKEALREGVNEGL
jgi:hypothetical protein